MVIRFRNISSPCFIGVLIDRAVTPTIVDILLLPIFAGIASVLMNSCQSIQVIVIVLLIPSGPGGSLILIITGDVHFLFAQVPIVICRIAIYTRTLEAVLVED